MKCNEGNQNHIYIKVLAIYREFCNPNVCYDKVLLKLFSKCLALQLSSMVLESVVIRNVLPTQFNNKSYAFLDKISKIIHVMV